MKLLQKSLRETHLEATVARFEFPGQIGRKSRIPQFGIIWLVAAKLVFNVGYFPSGVPGPAAPPAPRGGAGCSRLAGQGSPLQARDPEFQLFIFWKVRVAGRVHLQPVPTRIFCRRI